MKKRSSVFGFVLFSLVIISLSVGFISATIQTSASNGMIKSDFLNSDKIYIKGNSGFCFEFKKVTLYIVESGKTDLDDVRGSFQEIDLTDTFAIPFSTMIWENPLVGEYDIIIDCNCDGNIHYSDPKTSFIVSAATGNGSVVLGPKNPENHFWQYDSEEPNLINEMMQVKVVAGIENINLKNITIKAGGSGDDSQIDKLEIYLDENSNGIIDSGETIVGDSQPAFRLDNGIVDIELGLDLEKNIEKSLLFVYTMNSNISEGDFNLSIQSLIGIGVESKKVILFKGLPLSSGIKTVMPEKSCLGDIVLEIIPNPASINESVIARISGINGCVDKIISLQKNPCDSFVKSQISKCSSGRSGCDISFEAVANRTYYACIDKNLDKDTSDPGESSYDELLVVTKVIEEINMSNVSEEGVGEENLIGEDAGITGEVIGKGLVESLGGSSFLFLLEITLLLILFVLVMILFRLKGRGPVVDEEILEESARIEEKKKDEKKK